MGLMASGNLLATSSLHQHPHEGLAWWAADGGFDIHGQIRTGHPAGEHDRSHEAVPGPRHPAAAHPVQRSIGRGVSTRATARGDSSTASKRSNWPLDGRAAENPDFPSICCATIFLKKAHQFPVEEHDAWRNASVSACRVLEAQCICFCVSNTATSTAGTRSTRHRARPAKAANASVSACATASA
ncbi:hypothetical protein [Azohydromonas aeria]|uniref:hypothetical protein n=1 Tax=Azohydromonas aeria TaxID=2590212 RepID=UPI0012F9CC88|nr:hypothetical protein [Azohydromonas aeria]